jgi:hypothetical protein
VVSVYSIFDSHSKRNVFSDEITIICVQNTWKIRGSAYILVVINYFHFFVNFFFKYRWCWSEDNSYRLRHTISWYFFFLCCYILYICCFRTYLFVRSFLLSCKYLFSTCISWLVLFSNKLNWHWLKSLSTYNMSSTLGYDQDKLCMCKIITKKLDRLPIHSLSLHF